MRYRDFYCEKLDPKLLESVDSEHKEKMKILIRELERGTWTKKQKHRQRSSILPNIALYQVFIDNGISKEKSYELVKSHSFYVAEKVHKSLRVLSKIPNFFSFFRFFMRKGMAGEEIWISEILTDTPKEYSTNVLKCLWFDTCSYFGCPELCEVFCLCDHIVFGNMEKFQFERSRTLGMRGEKCDFSFRSKL